MIAFLANYGKIELDEAREHIYCLSGHRAVRHLFEVASGLDSMALGETQILGQIKNAYCIADGYKSTRGVLNNLFQKAIAVGKRARSETRISTGAFSIGAAAAQLAKFVLGNLKGRKAFLVGAGDMSKLAATHLRANGIGKIYISNRTRANVEGLAQELGAEVVDFDCFEEALGKVDIVISSTGSRRPIITKSRMAKAMAQRSNAPVFMIDIAVPRDIEESAAELNGVFVYNIDDLQYMVDRCKAEREAEIGKVQAIIDEETAEFTAYLRTLEAVPLIKELREKFEAVYAVEWERCSTRLSHLSQEDRERVRKAIKSTVNKLTHDPILRLKEYAANGGGSKLDTARELFGLTSENGEAGKCDCQARISKIIPEPRIR